ncbi:glycoside hydrolase family 2 TIM barrel-domain containing protein [Atopococcus tabaci]|uniref:glycoside hydrolase family 2 TIM barrel-domain containing protein n=1 Tax=Atopococcus tabaci TaxID=269774 RepID=UPI00240A65CA|nr:glycoside hydrolase family 2 TIM barrel-domain containing protein [Atopococcus tabaci]
MYWADKLGFLVWGESASAQYFNEKAVDRVTEEWKEIVRRDYNHPSIVTWVSFNESWGIPEVQRNTRQQYYSQALYHMLHALDGTRPVISNDDWEMTVTDICAVHHYRHGEMDEPEQ